jgi:potassium-transporting ATPase KdpC subunit
MKKTIITSIRFLVIMTIFTGLIYPLVMTGISQVFFPGKSNGSMIVSGDTLIGSELIGQNFTSDKYVKGRPSAISYNPVPSSGTNQGPASKTLADSINSRKLQFIKENGLPEKIDVPSEMLTASSSGVDPHISIESAKLQINRVIKARGWDNSYHDKIMVLINRLIEKPQFGIFGEERINVLKLNIELDNLQ